MRRAASRIALLIGLLAAATMGCGSSGGDGAGNRTITVAALPLVDTAGLHIAIQRGFFEAEGLRVRIRPVAQSIQALPALKTGQVDVIAGGNYVTFLQAQEQGTLKLRVLAAGASLAPHFMTVLTMPRSPIRQPKDLVGRTVAVNILNNVQSLTLNATLKADGVDPSKVRYRAVPFPQMGAALQKGQVDAVHVAEPFATDLARKLGARVVLDGGSGAAVAGLPVSGYLSTQRFVEKYPKAAAAFQRAIEKAQQAATGDRKTVDQVLPSYARLDAKTAAALSLPGYPASLDPAQLQRLADMMLQSGLLKTRLDARSLVFAPKTQ
ncbi:ABC transporter substrate-binding protein [Actinomadura sp. DC4]|uniref:ABC transporter substrate-binding protein n=1 Tax=Actinomadura sp. DC4 TaxID=3055069 RepID=UPI0025AF3755|nr:ABC transporter substrate-binding protein [Actinomadura sp. DC4]MDN3360120.1 ABC transporter substrate-binding protein [Actinomadura sp. DC4]